MKVKIIFITILVLLCSLSRSYSQIPNKTEFHDKTMKSQNKNSYRDQTYVFDYFDDGWEWDSGDINSSNGEDYWDIHDGTYYGNSAWCAQNNDGGGCIW